MTLLQRQLYRHLDHWRPWQRWSWLLGGSTLVHAAPLLLLAPLIVDEPLRTTESIKAFWRHTQLLVSVLGWWLASLSAAAWLNRRELRQPVRVP
ncbi:hypothetical protein [Hymenobacter sp. CRA2]|uniref:hypothetical protein n=1 Tax=Hymenobacter sp. CRA2 TaxID=1955620 RepID=UPI001115FE10|nr:hypothetical protein [Hymenobacter sp. CRA2]